MTRPVVRRWEATVARERLDGWVAAHRERVLPEVRTVDGFVEVAFHAAHAGDPCRVTVLTTWRDMEAVRRFAGDEPARAVVPDFMAPFFEEADAEATFHDELLRETRA